MNGRQGCRSNTSIVPCRDHSAACTAFGWSITLMKNGSWFPKCLGKIWAWWTWIIKLLRGIWTWIVWCCEWEYLVSNSNFTALIDRLSTDRYRSYCNRKSLSRPRKCLSCRDLNENSRMSTSTRELGYRRTWSQFISIFRLYCGSDLVNVTPSCLGQWCVRLTDMIPTFGMQFYA
jgi:hypothetical protein